MSAPNIKSWRYDNGTYTSPVFPDIMTFSRVKTFFIRAGIHTDSDEGNRIIRVPVSGPHGKRNKDKLKFLKLLD